MSRDRVGGSVLPMLLALGLVVGALGAACAPPPAPFEAPVTINGGAPVVTVRDVRLTISSTADLKDIRVVNGTELGATRWVRYSSRLDWRLSPGDGTKVVTVQVRDRSGAVSRPARASVRLNEATSFNSVSRVSLPYDLEDPFDYRSEAHRDR